MLAHQTAEKCAIGLQQQLAQIRDMKFEYPHIHFYSIEDCEKTYHLAMASCDQTIAALRLDNAQKAERIAELEGGKKWY
jgi:hypothetical protein